MFAAPQELRAEVFARLPDALRVRNRSSRWADVQRGGAPTDSFLEGPSFDVSGRLYLVDIPWGRIFTVSPEGEFELFAEYDGEPERPALCAERRSLLHGPGAHRSSGSFGAAVPAAAERNAGPAVGQCSEPQRAGAESRRERAVPERHPRGNCIWRVPMAADGTPFKVGVFVQLSGGLGGPDGLAIDAEGNLAVAHLGLGTVWLFSALGEPIYRIRSPLGLATTNVAYHDRFLYITESETGTVLRVELPTPGNRMYSHT